MLDYIRQTAFFYAFVVPLAMIVLLIWYVVLTSRCFSRIADERARLSGQPKPKVIRLGLLMPLSRTTDPKEIAYRKFYRAEIVDLVMKSAFLWAVIILISFI